MRTRHARACAPVAQLDRVPGFEPGGRRFESFRARHYFKYPTPESKRLRSVQSDSNRSEVRKLRQQFTTSGTAAQPEGADWHWPIRLILHATHSACCINPIQSESNSHAFSVAAQVFSVAYMRHVRKRPIWIVKCGDSQIDTIAMPKPPTATQAICMTYNITIIIHSNAFYASSQ